MARPDRGWLDLAAAFAVTVPGAALLFVVGLAQAVVNRLVPGSRSNGPVLLCLVVSQFEEIIAKGVGDMIGEREEGGYFRHVHAVYFPSRGWERLAWSPCQTIWTIPLVGRALRDFGWPRLCEALTGLTLFGLALFASPWVRHRVDVVRGQDPAMMGLLAGWLGLLTGRPCCVSVHADHDKRHGLDPTRGSATLWGSRRLGVLLEGIALRSATAVWVVRPSLGAWARRRRVSQDRLRVIPHGVVVEEWAVSDADVAAFRLRQGLVGRRIVLFVGRLVRTNYVDDALDVAARVVAGRPDVTFVFVGDGDQRQRLETRSREIGVGTVVVWAGFRPRDEVRYWRGVSDVQLCLMGGFSLLEAAASGRPVISYDVEWHAEVIRDGETGVLVREGDVEAAAAAVGALLDRPDVGRVMGQRARALIEERFTLRQASAQRVAFYDELIGGGRQPR